MRQSMSFCCAMTVLISMTMPAAAKSKAEVAAQSASEAGRPMSEERYNYCTKTRGLIVFRQRWTTCRWPPGPIYLIEGHSCWCNPELN